MKYRKLEDKKIILHDTVTMYVIMHLPKTRESI